MVGRGLRRREFCGQQLDPHTFLIRAVGGLLTLKTTRCGIFWWIRPRRYFIFRCRIELKVVQRVRPVWLRSNGRSHTPHFHAARCQWHSQRWKYSHWCDSANNKIRDNFIRVRVAHFYSGHKSQLTTNLKSWRCFNENPFCWALSTAKSAFDNKISNLYGIDANEHYYLQRSIKCFGYRAI